MPYLFQYPTVLLSGLRLTMAWALRLLPPILLIYCIPSEQTVLENLFLGEGCCRVCRSLWDFRSSLPLLLKKTGIFSGAFACEELLQELCLRVLISM